MSLRRARFRAAHPENTQIKLSKRGQLVATTLGGLALPAVFIGAHYLIAGVLNLAGAA